MERKGGEKREIDKEEKKERGRGKEIRIW